MPLVGHLNAISNRAPRYTVAVHKVNPEQIINSERLARDGETPYGPAFKVP